MYELTRCYPATERFELIQQTRAAAVSVSANIAEGCGRYGPREFARFVSIALGSESELESHIEIAIALGYADRPSTSPLLANCQELRRMLVTLYHRLSK